MLGHGCRRELHQTLAREEPPVGLIRREASWAARPIYVTDLRLGSVKYRAAGYVLVGPVQAPRH